MKYIEYIALLCMYHEEEHASLWVVKVVTLLGGDTDVRLIIKNCCKSSHSQEQISRPLGLQYNYIIIISLYYNFKLCFFLTKNAERANYRVHTIIYFFYFPQISQIYFDFPWYFRVAWSKQSIGHQKWSPRQTQWCS